MREDKDLNLPSERTEMSEKREQGNKVTDINSAFLWGHTWNTQCIASDQQRLIWMQACVCFYVTGGVHSFSYTPFFTN